MTEDMVKECPECKGSGWLREEGKHCFISNKCPSCQGTGRIPKSVTQDIINKYNSGYKFK